MDNTITLKEACERASMTRRGLLLNAEKEHFHAYKNNQGRWVIDAPSFQRWLDDRSSPPSPATTVTDSTTVVTDSSMTELLIANSVLHAKLDAAVERAERAEQQLDKLINSLGKPWWKRW